MALDLPTTVLPRVGTPTYRRFGSDLTPPLGGPVQRLDRLGDRFQVAVAYPPMVREVAHDLIAVLIQAQAEGEPVRLPLSQRPFDEHIGAPQVAGAGQAGLLLDVDGLTAGATVRRGIFFSLIKSGVSYLHLVTETVTADGSGAAELRIAPMLRMSPADNSTLAFASPVIEGLVEGRDLSWDVGEAMLYGVEFTISEAR